MENITKRRWYFRNGLTYQDYLVLYDDGKFNLVQDEASGRYSFGCGNCFGTVFGYPVNWSCLDKAELAQTLDELIALDRAYCGQTGGLAEEAVAR